MRDTSKNFLRFFQDNPPTFLKDDTTKMRVNGKLFDYSDPLSVEKLFNPTVVLEHDLIEWHKEEPATKVRFLQNLIEGTFRQEVLEKRQRREKLQKKLGKSEFKLPDADYILNHLQPARVVGDARKEAGWRFLDVKTKEVTPYDYHSIYFALSGDFEDKLIKSFMNNIAHIQVEYNPYDTYKLRLKEGSNNIYSINEYRPPAWTFLEDVEPGIDEDIQKLIDHLFPDEDSKEFVMNWIYHSLTTRAGTYLYLCGGQGSGKNTFANLLAALHGHENSSNPKQDSLRNRFNLYLRNKRFIFFDEFNCRNRQDKDQLKSIINSRIQVEGKNKDHEEIDIFASYIIANNSLEAIGLDPIDRRFSVPDISDDNIVDRYGRKWIEELTHKINNEDRIIAAFASHLSCELGGELSLSYSSEQPFQRKRFEEIVVATARLGISQTLNKVLKREDSVYDYFDEKDEFLRLWKGQKYPSIQDWQKFFKDVRIDGKPLGVVDGKEFIPREEYRSGAEESDLG